MSNYQFDFSIIIPHKDSLEFLSKLLSTIPNSEKIEIIVVDNSPIPIKREEVNSDKHLRLLYSSPERGAGGARNVGIENAHGKWLLFADADDYFTDNAFETFYSQFNSDAELIFFCVDGTYLDSGEHSDRGDSYTQMVKDFLNGKISEMDIRLNFPTPWAKMIRHELVDRHHLRYDEVPVNNDDYFSLLIGYYATKIAAVDKITYIATVSRGSLTQRRDYEAIKSRFLVILRHNQFLKKHNLSQHQKSIMFTLFQARSFGIKKMLEFISLLIKYKQNPFIGYNRWFNTYILYKKNYKRDKKYITY
jgi:glycosyltransferase involved in cell wall biosynthesis